MGLISSSECRRWGLKKSGLASQSVATGIRREADRIFCCPQQKIRFVAIPVMWRSSRQHSGWNAFAGMNAT